jgi:two-component system sensor histidine kinase KdpD
LGLTLSAVAFLLFDTIFLQPYYTLVVARPLDWLVLVAFLITSIVATHLLNRAEERAREVERLGAERARLMGEAERAEAFRQADALKTALIATVSHDLRTPLTTIKALAHRLAEAGDEDALSIEEESDRLNRFVTDMLDLSRLSAGTLPLKLELNAVDELIASAVDRARGTLGGRDVRVVRAADEVRDAPILFGTFDLVQSIHVLVNLLENAAKYSPPGAALELLVSRDGDRIRIAVADRGPGIAAEERARIFEPFYRPSGAPPDAGSAGLGLAIARGLAEAQHGALRYAPRDGGGSLFTLELPAADPTVGE